jgi:hypothetical protein
LPHRYHRITTESVFSLRFSERLALEMITAVLWPLATDERIGLLLTTLADNVADVAETDEELDALVGRLRLLFKLECLDRHMAPTKHPNSLEAQAHELGAPASDDKTNH